MSKTFLKSMAACPFFKSDTNAARGQCASIICEGVYGLATQTLFKKQEDKNAHGETFCVSIHGCKRCEIYKLIELKYKNSGSCKQCKRFERCDAVAAIYIGDLPPCKDFERG